MDEKTVELKQKIDELREKMIEIEKEKSDIAEDAAAFKEEIMAVHVKYQSTKEIADERLNQIDSLKLEIGKKKSLLNEERVLTAKIREEKR